MSEFRESITEDPDYNFRQSVNVENFDGEIDVMNNEDFKDKYDKLVKEADDLDYQDRIFLRLCNADELKQIGNSDNDRCFIGNCQKKFGLMSKKHQCKFCGHLVCERHGQKHRANPEDQVSFSRICVVCEDKYLKKTLNEEFNEKKNIYDEQMKGLEKKQKNILNEKKEKQREFDILLQKQNHAQGTHENKKIELTNKSKRIQQDVKILKQQYSEDDIKLQQLREKVDDYRLKIAEKKELLDSRQSEEILLTQKISATEQDITQTQLIVDAIEKKITENNLRIEQMRVSKVNPIGQQIAQQKEQYERSQSQQVENIQGYNGDSMYDNEESDKQANGRSVSSIYYAEPDVQQFSATPAGGKKKKKGGKKEKGSGEDNENCQCSIF